RVLLFFAVGIPGSNSLQAQPAFFRKDIPVGDRPAALTVGDFNGDSKPDLVVSTSGGFYILLGAGGGNFGRPIQFAAGPPLGPLIAADFNGDGKLDLSIGGRVLLGSGDGSFSAPLEVGRATWSTTGDFNRDGKPDLVLSDPIAGTLSIFLGKGDGAFQLS